MIERDTVDFMSIAICNPGADPEKFLRGWGAESTFWEFTQKVYSTKNL